MEPDVGSQVVQEVEAKGIDVAVLIMDDDTTTMARIRKDIEHHITKWSDRNHTSKHLGNSLYNLQKKHRVLNTSVIKYLQKCFNYALAQNKGNTENCRTALQQIVPHAFGEHAGCGAWCGAIQDPDVYRHSNLQKDLTGDSLRQDLNAVFQVFINNAEKIAPGGSTKDVESFNNMVASKAPKRCHFSASGNLSSRVNCAVAQKNLGNTYVNRVNIAAGLSPGKVFEDFAVKKDKERKRQREYTNTKTYKKKKIIRKLQKHKSTCAKELREGTTYKSAVATVPVPNADVTEIPSTTLSPTVEPVGEYVYQKVFCDIETTSLQKDADIVQISAVCGTDIFDQYVTPTRSVAPAATAVTGLSSQGGVLFHNGTPVSSLPLQGAMQNFLGWLDDRAPVILIGHNFKTFDFPRILRAVDLVKLKTPFQERVVGGVDTLPIFRAIYPEQKSFKQEELVSAILHENYEAHNAIADVKSLQKLFNASVIDDALFLRNSFSTGWGFDMLCFKTQAAKNVDTLQSLVDRKVLSKGMAEKVGSSGLQLCHLQLAFTRGGLHGIESLLSEKTNTKVRVTANKRVISSIASHFEK